MWTVEYSLFFVFWHSVFLLERNDELLTKCLCLGFHPLLVAKLQKMYTHVSARKYGIRGIALGTKYEHKFAKRKKKRSMNTALFLSNKFASGHPRAKGSARVTKHY